MTISFNAIHEGHLGYAAIFLCVGIGFLFLRGIERTEAGPGYWALSFISNSIGFFLWSGAIALAPWAFYALGELFHVAGFFLLAYGALRSLRMKAASKGPVAFLIAWSLLWLLSLALVGRHPFLAAVSLKSLRAVLFLAIGLALLLRREERPPAGKQLAGVCFILWFGFVLASIFAKINDSAYFGFLVGIQTLSAFGLLAIVLDRRRLKTELMEIHLKELEGILPICSYCKKIRDERNEWHALEAYIEDRSKAEFSHGICPECLEKNRPDK